MNNVVLPKPKQMKILFLVTAVDPESVVGCAHKDF